jgi:O-antigen ligase
MMTPLVRRPGQGAAQKTRPEPGSRRIDAARWIALAGLLVPTGIIEDRQPGAVADEPFTPVTLLRGITPVVCLLVALLLSRTAWRPRGPRELLLSVYLLVVVASTLWSLAPRLTLLKAAHLVVAHALLVVIVRHWQSRRQALDEIAAVVYGVVLLALAGIAVAPQAAFRPSSDDRLFSVFPALQPVVLGMVAMVALIMLAAGAGPAVTRRLPVRLLLVACTLGVLLLTRTRSAFVLLVLGLLVLFWLQGRRRLAGGVLAATAAGAVLLALTGAGRALIEAVAGGPGRFSATSVGGRLPMWNDAVQVVENRPLLGFGYFAGHRFGEYAERFQVTTGRSDPYIDGTWIETALDLGLLGVAALGVFVGYCAWSVWRSRGFATALQCALLAVLLVYSVQDFTIQQPGYPMFLLGSLLLLPPGSREERGAHRAQQVVDPSAGVGPHRGAEPVEGRRGDGLDVRARLE